MNSSESMKPKVVVLKRFEEDIGQPFFMWRGWCTGCNYTTQYHSWGATVGDMLRHRTLGCELQRLQDFQRGRKRWPSTIPDHGRRNR